MISRMKSFCSNAAMQSASAFKNILNSNYLMAGEKHLHIRLTRKPWRAGNLAAIGVMLWLSTAPSFGQNSGVPLPTTFSETFAPSPSTCQFPVKVELAGRAKTINLSGGRTITTAPQQYVLVTNELTGKPINIFIPGVIRTTTDASGVTTYTATGPNLLTDPDYGLVLVTGNFSFAFDSNGMLVQGLTKQGGTITNVCALLS